MIHIIDSIDLGTIDGFQLRAELVPDTDPANASDIDFVGIIVTASRAGIDLGSDSLWGIIQYGDPLRTSRMRGSVFAAYRADLIDNAIADAHMKLAELFDAGTCRDAGETLCGTDACVCTLN